MKIFFCLFLFAVSAFGKSTILCDDKSPKLIKVKTNRVTVLNFPFPPKDVVPGELSFDFKQVKNDLLIKPTRSFARTNLVVYLDRRRCNFEIVSTKESADDILIVKDAQDSKVEYHE